MKSKVNTFVYKSMSRLKNPGAGKYLLQLTEGLEVRINMHSYDRYYGFKWRAKGLVCTLRSVKSGDPI